MKYHQYWGEEKDGQSPDIPDLYNKHIAVLIDNQWRNGLVVDFQKGSHQIIFDGETDDVSISLQHRSWRIIEEREKSSFHAASQFETKSQDITDMILWENPSFPLEDFPSPNDDSLLPGLMSTTVTFHLQIDPSCVTLGYPHIQVQFKFSEQWIALDPLAMQQTTDPKVWSTNVNVPFSLVDFCKTGLIRFKFMLCSRSGILIMEQLQFKEEPRVRKNIFACWRPKEKGHKFATANKKPLQVIGDFIHYLLYEVADFSLHIFEDFKESFRLVARRHVEDIFEQQIKSCQDEIVAMDSHVALVFLAMIGCFGLTSSEKVASKATFSPFDDATTYVSAIPPKPTLWCFYCCNTLNLLEISMIDWSFEFGERNTWISLGMCEAVERLAEYGDFDYLKLTPFVQRAALNPRIPSGKRHFASAKTFEKAVEEIGRFSWNVLIELEANPIESAKLQKEDLDHLYTVCVEWCSGILRYCPSLKQLHQFVRFYFPLFSTKLRESLIPLLVEIFQYFDVGDETEFNYIKTFVSSYDYLHTPQMAVSLLKNCSLDFFQEALIAVLKTCLKDFEVLEPSTEHNTIRTVGLDGIWHELNIAAKEVIRRHIGNPPSELKTEMNDNSWNLLAFFPLQKTRESNETIYFDSMMRTIASINYMLAIPFFSSNSGGLFFELNRAWFLNGLPMIVCKCLFHVIKEVSRIIYHAQILEYLKKKICSHVRVCCTCDSAIEIIRSLRVFISQDCEISHEVISAVIESISVSEMLNISANPKDLKSVLKLCPIWLEIIDYLHNTNLHGALWTLLQSIEKNVLAVREHFKVFSCTMFELCILGEYFSELSQLLEFYSGESINIADFDIVQSRKYACDMLLEHFETYIALFCAHGTKIDVLPIKQVIENIQKSYYDMTLDEIEVTLKELKPSSFVSNLYKLRSSDIFLQLWKAGCKNVCYLCIKTLYDLSMLDVEEDNDPNPEDDGQDNQETHQTAEEERLRRKFEIQDTKFKLLENSNKYHLSQDDVENLLLPKVRQEWQELATKLLDDNLTIIEFEIYFESLTTQIQLREEVKLLLSAVKPAPTFEEVDNKVSSLLDFQVFKSHQKWFPKLLKLHLNLLEILESDNEDEFIVKLTESIKLTDLQYQNLTMKNIPNVVGMVKRELNSFSHASMDFISLLGETPKLLTWLQSKSNTEEFNKLMHVVRPCTDDIKILSALASLVHIRNLLIPSLNGKAGSFRDFLVKLNSSLDSLSPEEIQMSIWHLDNVMGNFDAMMVIFERQTKSPGIKACFEMRDLITTGFLTLQLSSNSSQVVEVQFEENATFLRIETYEYIVDLRNKLLMTEIPDELDNEFGAKNMALLYVEWTQILIEIVELLKCLYSSGNEEYQSYTKKMKVDESIDAWKQYEADLQIAKHSWFQEVDSCRHSFYFLNYFTMKNILKMLDYLSHHQSLPVSNSPQVASLKEVVEVDGPNDDLFELMQQMGFDHEWSEIAFENVGYNVESAIDFCLSNHHLREKMLSDRFNRRFSSMRNDYQSKPVSQVLQIQSLLALIISHADSNLATNLINLWDLMKSQTCSNIRKLGMCLSQVFSDYNDLFQQRTISTMSSAAKNKADLLVPIENDSLKIPIFVCCTENVQSVYDTVLSIYFRKKRLPEPGEILFCSTDTTEEEINLILFRFINSKKHVSSNFTYIIANVHELSYSMQHELVFKLKDIIQRVGVDNAGSLVICSGKSNQAVHNSLSTYMIDIPPLEVIELQRLVKESIKEHWRGSTLCIASEINGGGKSSFIMSAVSDIQAFDECILYRKISLRENSTTESVISALSAHQERTCIYHIEVAQVVPFSKLNPLLFNLLFVGVIYDSLGSAVYQRKIGDSFYIEIANSPNNETCRKLRICHFVPFKILSVNPNSLSFEKPQLLEMWNGDFFELKVNRTERVEMKTVCKWLRAIKSGKISQRSNNYCPDYSPWLDDDISAEECFSLLFEKCCSQQDSPSPSPSWTLFNSLVVFLNMQFSYVERYTLLQSDILSTIPGLEMFRSVFIKLLLETSVDFSSRSLPQLQYVGPTVNSWSIAGDENQGGSNASSKCNMTQRFQKLISWEETEHPIVVFKSEGCNVSGVDIISLATSFTNRYFSGDLRMSLEQNKIQLSKNWKKMSTNDAISLLQQIQGSNDIEGSSRLEPGYVLTIDNVLKMMIILLRLRFHIPVIINGETGCGKSTLLRNMCNLFNFPLYTLNIHGGIEAGDILEWMQEKIEIAVQLKSSQKIIVFLDEINTSNNMGLFKELICDRMLDGHLLPDNLLIVAACNPYRRKSTKSKLSDDMIGLQSSNKKVSILKAEYEGTGIRDNLKDLVYRVHPLAESLMDFVFDFGSLTAETESLYVKSIISQQLNLHRNFNEDDDVDFSPLQLHMSPIKEFSLVFSTLICEAQETVRRLCGERAAASLRDVSRCIRVYQWFGEFFIHILDPTINCTLEEFYNIKPSAHVVIMRSVVLSLSYCYVVRLPREERKTLVNAIVAKWRSLQIQSSFNWNQRQLDFKCSWLALDTSSFFSILKDSQISIALKMKIDDGVSLNEALCENLFMLLVSILNRIPIYIVGKPGSSKTLAMSLIQTRMNGEASDIQFCKSFPSVEVFTYQCSPLSTSQGILKVFDTARKYKQETSNTIVVILLDEIGLADESPHLPLKILHKLLDENQFKESFVGISNWSLDPAKMNRAVHIYRPSPTIEDLTLTAEGMVKFGNLKGYLGQISAAYNHVYQNQKIPDFWGLRDFYSIVRFVNSALLKQSNENVDVLAVNGETLYNAVLRNFGGRPMEIDEVVEIYFSQLKLKIKHSQFSKEELIRQNLADPNSRHIMLLSRNSIALHLLHDCKILDPLNSQIIFGSDFPLDKSDLKVHSKIQKIKLCMAEGVSVVLVNCDCLFESLYDLFNQHYVECAGNLYCRLAFGPYTQLCSVNRKFKIIVVVDTDDAYGGLAPPLLNRFEKQVFERNDVIDDAMKILIKELHTFINLITDTQAGEALNITKLREVFCGFHGDTISSLVVSLAQNSSDNQVALLQQCIVQLLWIAKPESMCRLMQPEFEHIVSTIYNRYGLQVNHIYFSEQSHSTFQSLVQNCIENWRDEIGSNVVILTCSTLAKMSFRTKILGYKVTTIYLQEIDEERQFEQEVNKFFESSSTESILLIECDPETMSRHRVEHAKFIIQATRTKYSNTIPDRSNDKPKGCHVVLVMHLSRSDDFQATYFTDFDSCWKVVYVDSIFPDSHYKFQFPPLESLLSKSLLDIFRAVDTHQFIMYIFRNALSRIIYVFERSSEDFKRQVYLLHQACQNSSFVKITRLLMEKLIIAKFGVKPICMYAFGEVKSSFQASIYKVILDSLTSILSLIICHADRNQNLDLLFNGSMSDLWIYLYQKSIQVEALVSSLRQKFNRLSTNDNYEIVDLKNDSFSEEYVFKTKFPFSVYVMNVIDSFKKTASMDEFLLAKQFSALSWEGGLDGDLTLSLLCAYCHDLVSTKCSIVEGMSREVQSDLVFHLLSIHYTKFQVDFTDSDQVRKRTRVYSSEADIKRLTQIHFRFWQLDHVLELYFDVLRKNIIPHDIAVDYLFKLSSSLDYSAHAGLLNLVNSYLSPTMFLKDVVVTELQRWFALVSSIKPTYFSLLDLIDNEFTKQALLNVWRNLEFTISFLKDLALPMEISHEIIRQFIKKFSSATCLCKIEIYDNLVRTLADATNSIGQEDGKDSVDQHLPFQFSELHPSDGKEFRLFLEYYIFEVVLAAGRNLLTNEFLEEIILCLNENSIPVKFSTCLNVQTILPKGRSVNSILIEVFKLHSPLSSDFCKSCIKNAIGNAFTMNSPLAVTYVLVKEEFINANAKYSVFDKFSLLRLNDVENMELLDNIVLIRSILRDLAVIVTTEAFNHDGTYLNDLWKSLNSLMECDYCGLQYEMRLFFLKCIERLQGISNLRALLVKQPFSNFCWMKNWLDTDVRFSRFLGTNKLPRDNPFMTQRQFTNIQTIIKAFILTGDLPSSDYFQSIDGYCKQAVLQVLYQEIGVFGMLSNETILPIINRSAELLDWLNTSCQLIPIQEKMIYTTFGFGRFSNCKSLMLINEESSIDEVLKHRVMIHIASCALHSDANHPFSFLNSLIFNPKFLAESYFPTMEEDARKMAQKVLGGRWYACPNGHPFFVDLCGRPTRIQKCSACGTAIGGENHNLLDDNIDLGNVGPQYNRATDLEDRTEKKYCLNVPGQGNDDKYYSVRGFSPLVTRILRLILHTSLVAGSLVLGDQWKVGAAAIFNSSYPIPDDIEKFFINQLDADWQIMRTITGKSVDDIAVIIHATLGKVTSSDTTMAYNTLDSLEKRKQWEVSIGKCAATFDCASEQAFSAAIYSASKKFDVDANEGSDIFVSELQETNLLTNSKSQQIARKLLWQYSKPFKFDEFVASLNFSKGNDDKYPVLWKILSMDYILVDSLKFIPSILEWIGLICGKFSGRIDREKARSILIQNVFDDIHDITIRQKWENSFESFSTVWNKIWTHVHRFGCIRFSSDFNQLRMSKETPISFSIPNEVDEGNCPLALLHFLVEKHNSIAQLIDEVTLTRSRGRGNSSLRALNRIPVVSTKHITQTHTIQCNVTRDFAGIVQKYCVADVVKGNYQYDFEKAENMLIDRYLSNIPAIDLEIPGFRFVNEQHLSGGIQFLRLKLKQEELSKESIDRIKKDISQNSNLLHDILEILETVIAFLSATGGSAMITLNESLQNMTLKLYVQEVLLMESSVFSLGSLQQIKLSNLESLWNIIVEFVKGDDRLSKVHDAYKHELSASSRESLLIAFKNPQFKCDIFFKTLKTWIVDSLVEKHISENISLKVCIENIEQSDGLLFAELKWFTDSFPSDVLLKEACEVLKLLKTHLQQEL